MTKKRLPAEWEQQQMIQLALPKPHSDWRENYEEVIATYVELIAAIVRFQPVLLICEEVEAAQKIIPKRLHQKIIWTAFPTNDTWCRDYGGITLIGEEQKTLLDCAFNGWGNKYPATLDNQVTALLYQRGFFPSYQYQKTGFVLEGGSIDSNGNGILLTTTHCLLHKERNPQLSQQEIERFLINQLAAKKVLWLEEGYLQGDDTDGHIDMLARFIAEDCICYVQCPDTSDPHYSTLQKMEKTLKTFTNLEGKAFRLFPLPLPDSVYNPRGERLPATYLNFLFINNALLIPQYNQAKDREVLAFFADFFPEKEIIGINCTPLIQQGGAIHCASMQYH